jgi:hypothetical protein
MLLYALRKSTNNLAMLSDSLGNRKLGACLATYTTQASCPLTCPLFKAGCYAETGTVGMVTKQAGLASSSVLANPIEIATEEAALINSVDTSKYPLRLHVVGDASTNEAARIIGDAAQRYRERFRQPVWTYTHAWREVDRAYWGNGVSVLASLDHAKDAPVAAGRGYAGALVVSEHVTPLATTENGWKHVPCPAQTGRARDCTQCRLCWDDVGLLQRKSIITFAAHGARKRMVQERTSGGMGAYYRTFTKPRPKETTL